MTLQTKLQSLYQPFTVEGAISCEVFHYTRGNYNKAPYVIWTETGEENSFNADNHKEEQQLTGLVDFYTLTEFDPIADSIQSVLDSEPVGYTISAVQYEEQTNLIHYQWRWWTCG